MFGYVKVAEDDLKVKEYKRYKKYYCDLCRHIANYSQIARMMLSYDMVFFSLLLEPDAANECTMSKKEIRRCRKKHDSSNMLYISAISVMLLYHKLENDIQDGERLKRFAQRLIVRGYKKALSDYPVIGERISCAMETLCRLENEQCSDFATLEHAFSLPFADIFTCAPDRDVFASLRAQLAYHVAAWVYWFDMLQDVELDRSSGDFNAILLQENETDARAEILDLLDGHVRQAHDILNMLPYNENTPIVKNIILLGLPMQVGCGTSQKNKYVLKSCQS